MDESEIVIAFDEKDVLDNWTKLSGYAEKHGLFIEYSKDDEVLRVRGTSLDIDSVVDGLTGQIASSSDDLECSAHAKSN